MKRKATFLFFVATVLVVGLYFFRMVQPFLLPLLMAGTLALLVQPVFDRVVKLLRGRRRLAASLTSAGVLLLVVLPVFVAVSFATQELIEYGGEFAEDVQQADDELAASLASVKQELSSDDYAKLREEILKGNGINAANFPNASAEVQGHFQRMNEFGPEEIEQSLRRESGAGFLAPESIPLLSKIGEWVSPYVSQSDIRALRANGLSMARAMLADVYTKTAGLITNLISFVIGFAIMMLAFYYFLAEGPTIADELESLLPFEPEDEVAVVKQFETLCRGVVLGTLVAAIAQAILVGIALAILHIPGTWLLTCLTVVLAMIPFIGAGGVYVPVSLYLFWSERYGAAVFLLLYGMILVSTLDNLIRAHMIHGTSRLHPLMALISALGALKLVGLLGIFIGPVVAGVFYALLKILQQKLNRMDRQTAL